MNVHVRKLVLSDSIRSTSHLYSSIPLVSKNTI